MLTVRVHGEGAALAQGALEQQLRSRIFQFPAEIAPHGPHAVGGIVAELGHRLQGGVGVLDGDALGLQALEGPVQHEPGDAQNFIVGQGLEADDLIHPVEKFRPEYLPQGLLEGAVRVFLPGGREAQRVLGGGQGLGAGVGGHNPPCDRGSR